MRAIVDPSGLVPLRPDERPRSTKTALFQTAPADFSDIEVIRQIAVSKDGTQVPVTILAP